jgi:hypothetical protein
MKRFNVVNCGRRFGKTILGEQRLIPPALKGFPVGWFAPTYKYLIEVWKDFSRILAPVIVRSNSQERRLELLTGGVVEFWTLDDPAAGRSRKYRRVVVDEAAMVPDLETRWNEAIRPTLTDYRGGADFYSTPKGMNFFWQAYAWGQDPTRPEWACWTMPTLANPFIAPAEVESARLQMPERPFRQEYLAEFLEECGGVFRGVFDVVEAQHCQPEPPIDGKHYVMGCDLARVQDFTVVVVLDDSGRQVHHERFNQISWERQTATIDRIARSYDARVYLDSTGVGDPIYERLRKAGLDIVPYGFTNASKEALIDNLAMKIEAKQVALMDIPAQTNELLAYQYELTPSRNVRMNAPSGQHDDCVIALALAAWGLAKPRPAYRLYSLT